MTAPLPLCHRCRSHLFCVVHGTLAEVDDFEKLWVVIDHKLKSQLADERENWRKVLIRRLRHFAMLTAHVKPVADDDKYVHPRQGRTGVLHAVSPLCQCGDPRRAHDEDGACRNCHCPMYANPD